MFARELEDLLSNDVIFALIETQKIVPLKKLITILPTLELNKKNEAGDTPLLFAIKHTKYAIAEALIDAKADVNSQDKKLTTALQLVARKKNTKMVEKIIRRKCRS